MFRSRSWFGGGWGRPKNPHSLEHLKYLYNVLSRNQNVSEHNRGLLVESLRSIAEILIWGDQNDSSVFDFFLEKNMLSFFLRIMRQRSGGSSFVCVQLLQTLNILFENIRNETSLYYLLSNNHVNSIIVHKFDFSDEEVMAYYISFLKTLSLKLNAHTIHFFYNEHTNDFPLYTEAIKFFNHPESMVRIAVRTLTLNVYKVDDSSMLGFIRDRTAAPYFSNIVWFIGKHIQELDACVRNDADHQSQNRLSDLVAEHLDHLHYLNDILCLNITDLNHVLTDHLLNKLLIPLYIHSLATTRRQSETTIETATQNLARVLQRNVTMGDSPPPEFTNGKVSCVVALFLLSQVFLIISHAPLIQTLAWIILKTDRNTFSKGVDKLVEHYNNEVKKCTKPSDLSDTASTDSSGTQTNRTTDSEDAKDLGVTNITDEEKQKLVTTPSIESVSEKPFLETVFNALDCTENDYAALFALSLLYAMANNKGVTPDLVEHVLRPKKSVINSSSAKDIKYSYSNSIVDRILHIVLLSCQPACRVRLVTLELGLKLLAQLVMCDGKNILSEAHKVSMESARSQSTALLRNFYKSEEIFLDMFEHELRHPRSEENSAFYKRKSNPTKLEDSYYVPDKQNSLLDNTDHFVKQAAISKKVVKFTDKTNSLERLTNLENLNISADARKMCICNCNFVISKTNSILDEPCNNQNAPLCINDYFDISNSSLDLCNAYLDLRNPSLDVTNVPLDLRNTPLDISNALLDTNNASLHLSHAVVDRLNTPLDICKIPLDLKKSASGLSNFALNINNSSSDLSHTLASRLNSLNISNFPVDLKNSDSDLSNAALNINNASSNLSHTLVGRLNSLDISNIPVDIKSGDLDLGNCPLHICKASLDLSDTLADRLTTTLDISNIPLNLKSAAADLSNVSLNVNNAPLDFSDALSDKHNASLDISNIPLDLKSAILELSNINHTSLDLGDALSERLNASLDLSTIPLDLINASLEKNNASLDLSNLSLEKNNASLDLKDRLNASLHISNIPFDISNTPLDTSNTQLDISNTLLDISNIPLDTSNTLLDISNTPLDISSTPLDISNNLLDISNTPLDISNTPLDISNNPVDISNTPLDISYTPLDISNATLDLSNTPLDLKSDALDLRNIPLHICASLDFIDARADTLNDPLDKCNLPNTPLDLSNYPLAISNTSLDLRNAPSDLRHSLRTTNTTLDKPNDLLLNVRSISSDITESPDNRNSLASKSDEDKYHNAVLINRSTSFERMSMSLCKSLALSHNAGLLNTLSNSVKNSSIIQRKASLIESFRKIPPLVIHSYESPLHVDAKPVLDTASYMDSSINAGATINANPIFIENANTNNSPHSNCYCLDKKYMDPERSSPISDHKLEVLMKTTKFAIENSDFNIENAMDETNSFIDDCNDVVPILQNMLLDLSSESSSSSMTSNSQTLDLCNLAEITPTFYKYSASDKKYSTSGKILSDVLTPDDILAEIISDSSEYCDMSKGSLNVEWLCMDSAILLPPTGTPLTGIDFTKRLPCGEVERAKRAIRVFFLARNTVLTLNGEVETQLPLTNPQSCVQIDQALDLNNSDLIACTVALIDGQKIRRFLVIDIMQLILVEPDTKRLGWGVAKLVGFLQDIEVSGDKDDSRCLHITIHKALSSSTANRVPQLSAKFIFDDNIRCMAAKQRLTKGRIKARQKKMQHIARLLDIPGQSGPPSPAYVGAGIYQGRAPGRGSRDNRPLFHTGRVPGFAAPRRDSTPGVVLKTDDRRRRESDSPSRIAMSNAKKEGGSTTPTGGNGKSRSRDPSGTRNKSREGSPRMPRPRSEEIPLELIKKVPGSLIDMSPKVTLLPRPTTPKNIIEIVTPSTSSEQEPVPAPDIVSITSEETSFIAENNESPRKKGTIETV